jgi:glyoxylase-like metal-dependent hydrolase (beta-lactamase superfamily II)
MLKRKKSFISNTIIGRCLIASRIGQFGLFATCLFFISFLSEAQSADGWFTAKQIADKTWLINEHGFDNIYVLEGRDSALVIDAGLGLADLKGFINGLTSKPLIIVNTHAHPDHAGGDWQFTKVFLGANDIDLAKYYTEPKTLGYIRDSLFKISIPNSLRVTAPDSMQTVFSPVKEGAVFKLGGRNVEVIDAKGHTPGSICLLDVNTKFLFTGDNNNVVTWLFLKESLPLDIYLQTQKKLVSMKDKYGKIFPGHGGSLSVETLNDLIACTNLILTGKGELKPYTSFAGEAKSCSFGSVTIAFDPNKLKTQ